MGWRKRKTHGREGRRGWKLRRRARANVRYGKMMPQTKKEALAELQRLIDILAEPRPFWCYSIVSELEGLLTVLSWKKTRYTYPFRHAVISGIGNALWAQQRLAAPEVPNPQHIGG